MKMAEINSNLHLAYLELKKYSNQSYLSHTRDFTLFALGCGVLFTPIASR